MEKGIEEEIEIMTEEETGTKIEEEIMIEEEKKEMKIAQDLMR